MGASLNIISAVPFVLNDVCSKVVNQIVYALFCGTYELYSHNYGFVYVVF